MSENAPFSLAVVKSFVIAGPVKPKQAPANDRGTPSSRPDGNHPTSPGQHKSMVAIANEFRRWQDIWHTTMPVNRNRLSFYKNQLSSS